jgi:hypothetical protein
MGLTNSRKRILWTAGSVLVGVAVGAAAMMSLRGGDGPYATSPPAARSMGAPSAASSFVTAVASNCDMAPVLPNAGEGDGRAVLQNKPAAASGSEVASLILSGKEAAAAGHQRDAEVTFLNACRNAAALRDSDGIPLADAMYQLGRHYATVAAFGAPRSSELLERAERLYSASLEGFRTRLGAAHEKTRFAQEGLTTVRQGNQGTAMAKAQAAAPAPAAPAPTAAPEAPPAPAPVTERLKEPEPAPVAKTPVKPPAAKEPAKRADPPPVMEAKRPTPPRPSPPRMVAEDEEDIAMPAPRPRPPRPVRPARPPEPETGYEPPPPRAAILGAPSGGGDIPTAEGSTGQP